MSKNTRLCGRVGFNLSTFRAILPAREFARVARRCGRRWRRGQPLIPEVVCWLMLYVALTTGSMTQGLAGAWMSLRVGGLTRRKPVSEEAFCQARARLPMRYFRLLLEGLTRRYQDTFKAACLWKGRFRVLAGDGTIITLVRNAGLVGFFGSASNQHGAVASPQVRLVALCSVFTGFCTGYVLMPLRFGELIGMGRLLRHILPDDLILLDRYFYSYAIIGSILRRRAHALIRVQSRYAVNFRRLQKLGPDHWLVELRPGRDAQRRHGLSDRLSMGLVKYQRKGFRVSWLLTTLTDPRDASAAELVDLYHRRWSIETIYREWKHTMNVQNIRSHTRLGVYKEVAAQVLLHNLVRWVMTEAAALVKTDPVRLSFTSSITLTKTFAVAAMGLPPATLRRRYQLLLKEIAAAVIVQRPGRSFPRKHDSAPRPKGHGRFVRPARLAKHA